MGEQNDLHYSLIVNINLNKSKEKGKKSDEGGAKNSKKAAF